MKNVQYFINKSDKVLNKTYQQFDTNPSIKSAYKFICETVLCPQKVTTYRFFPLIVYSQTLYRYHRTKGHLRAHLKKKVRPISLVAHHDALIYVKYADELNERYENFIKMNNFFEVPTAYRKDLHQSNITAAKEVFDFIVDSKDCWIIKGDFKGFFDNIRHKILKLNLSKVLAVDKLEPDWRAVLNSVTHYRWVESRAVSSAMWKARIENNKSSAYVKNRKELAELISKGNLKVKGPNQIGIPQGTPISAVLANVYMIRFDMILNKLVLEKHGIYRRYSDDFAIVIPKIEVSSTELNNFVSDVIKLSKQKTSLDIELHKTKLFSFNLNLESKMKQVDLYDIEHEDRAWFDYLGFVFDGDTVRMRDRSIYKFHYKSKRAINRFLRIENDRNQIKARLVPVASEKKRVLWKSGTQSIQCITQIPKQWRFENRISYTEKNMSYNLTAAKIATKMYLVGARYGEEYSMVGYAKRTQKVMSDNEDRYRVEVLEQIMHQLKTNQQRVRRIRIHNSYEK